MREIIVHTQKELDAALKEKDVDIVIQDTTEWLSVSGNATIRYVYGNATIQSVYGNATIQSVYGNATIKIFSSDVCLESVLMMAVIIMIGCVCKIKKKSKTVTVIQNKKAEYTQKDFINIYGCDDGYVTLYKSVNPKNGRDFYSDTIEYKGVVTCPDWNPDHDIECGNGLHLSPLPHLALLYNQGKLLKCKVHKNDFVVYPNNITKVRCKKVTVIGEYNH